MSSRVVIYGFEVHYRCSIENATTALQEPKKKHLTVEGRRNVSKAVISVSDTYHPRRHLTNFCMAMFG